MPSKISRRQLLKLGAIASAGVLAACAPKVVEKIVKETVVVAATPAPIEQITLRTLGTGREEIWSAFNEAHPNLTVEDVPITGDKFEKLTTMFATGDPPDLFNTSDVNWCKDRDIAVVQHVVLDEYLTRDEAEFDWNDIYPTITKYMKMPDGHYYFIPQWVNSNIMAYNVELFDEAGVPYPTKDWTWDDMVQAGKELTKFDDGMAMQYGKVTTFGWWGEYYYYQRQAGLENWLSPDGRDVYMDTPEAIEGLRFYLDCIMTHRISDKPGESLEGGFLGGGYAMWNFIHTGSWPGITAAAIKWDIMVPPKGTRIEGGEIALDSTAIGRGSKHLEESWTYLKWNSGKEGGKVWVQVGVPPIRKSVNAETWVPRKDMPDYPLNPSIYFDAMPYNMPVHWPPGSWDAWDILQKRVDLMLEGKMTPEETCNEAAEEMRGLIASGGKS